MSAAKSKKKARPEKEPPAELEVAEAAAPAVEEDEAPREKTGPTGILWIASYPKSVNTWTRALLNNLLKIIQDEDEGTPQNINRMNEYTIWDISAKPYEKIIGKPPKEVDRAEIAKTRAQQKRLPIHWTAKRELLAQRLEGLVLDWLASE